MPAGLRHLAHLHHAGAQIVEAECAIGAGDDAALASIEHVVGIGVEEDGPARQRHLSGISGAVVVQVVELDAVDVGGVEVAEIGAGDRVPFGQRDAVLPGVQTTCGAGQQPVRGQRLAHRVAAAGQAAEAVAAVAERDGRYLTGIQAGVVVGIEVHGGPGDAHLGVVVRRIEGAAAVQVFVHLAADGRGQRAHRRPAGKLAALPGVAGQVGDAGSADRQLVDAGRSGKAGQPADAPLGGAELGQGNARAQRHVGAVQRQRQIGQVHAGRCHRLVKGDVDGVHRRGARVGAGRGHAGHAGRHLIDKHVDKRIGRGVGRGIGHPQADVVGAGRCQREVAGEVLGAGCAGHRGQSQLGAGGGVGQPHAQAALRQVAGDRQRAVAGQPVAHRNAGVRAEHQIAGRQRAHDVHRPALGHLPGAGVAGQIAQAGAVHRQRVDTVLPHLPVEVGNAPGGGVNLRDGYFAGDQVGAAAVLGERHVVPVKGGGVHRLAQGHVERGDHDIARVGADGLQRQRRGGNGVSRPAAAGLAHAGNAQAVLRAGRAHGQHIAAGGGGEAVKPCNSEVPGVHRRDTNRAVQRHIDAITGQLQIGEVNAGRRHVA